jgi:hypothetical protein
MPNIIILHTCKKCLKTFLCDNSLDKCYCAQEIIYFRNNLYIAYFCSGVCVKKYVKYMDLITL